MNTIEIEEMGRIIGSNVRGLMRSRGVSRKVLAEKVGVTGFTITHICQGHGCTASTWIIFAIADVFDITADELCREGFYD